MRVTLAAIVLSLSVLILIWAWIVDAFGLSNPHPSVLVYETLRPVPVDMSDMELPGKENAQQLPVSWTLPNGWTQEAGGGMRLATLRVKDDLGEAEVSIIKLPGDAGGLGANINRWRGQVGLESADEAKIEEELKTTARQSGLGSYYWQILVNDAKPEKAFAVAIVPIDGDVLFVKLMATAEVVQATQQSFLEFCDSIQKPAAKEGAYHE